MTGSDIAGFVAFAFIVSTFFVPAGAQLVGKVLLSLGKLLTRHGRGVDAAYRGYKEAFKQ